MGVQFKARKISIIIDDPDEADKFMQGLIVARSNNSSEYFIDLIDGVNAIMEPYRKELAEAGIDAKPGSTKRKVSVSD